MRPRAELTAADAERILRGAARQAHMTYAQRRQRDEKLAMGDCVQAVSSAVAIVDETERIRRRDAQIEAAERGERVAACFAGARVPERYRAARIDDLARVPADARERYAAATASLRSAIDVRGIYAMCGEIGAGKTHLACALINAFCLKGRSARYLKAADYIRDYRSTWRMPAAGAEDRYEREHLRLALLVLDEWQVRRDSADENLILLRLLDKRYDSGGTTVLIGNHGTQAEFEESIDARVADRICDGGGVILCDWPSLRGRIQ